MKKYIIYIFCSLIIFSCKDNEENNNMKVIYYQDSSYHHIESLVGTLKYNETESSWIINPNRDYTNPFNAGQDETGATLIIENADDSYIQLKDKNVIISGKYKQLYSKIYDTQIGTRIDYYALTIENIEAFNETKTRAAKTNQDNIIEECGPMNISEPIWKLNQKSTPKSITETLKDYNFRVYFHVIRSSSGYSPWTKEYIASTSINNLNNYYRESGIPFTNYGSEYIDSDELNNFNDSIQSETMFYAYNHSNAIDVYIVTGGNNLHYAGCAENIPGTAYIIKGSYWLYSTLAHEMGHCLGLFHTHHGTSITEQFANTVPELVNGSNSTWAGDYIADTDADPCIWNNGVYAGTSLNVDANNEQYHPDPLNMMCYSGNDYREKFSRYQIDRILNTISSNYYLLSSAVVSNRKIQGSTFATTSTTYSINCPTNSVINWDVQCDTYSGLSGSITTTHQSYTGNNITLSNASGTNSKKYTLTATYTTPLGYVRSLNKTVYYIALSSQNGDWIWSTGNGNNTKTGTINMSSSSNLVEVYRGGTLYLRYIDATGANSDIYDDDFVFGIMTTPSFLTKASGSNHYFNCSSSATPGTYNGAMQLMVKNNTKIVSVSIKVIAPTGTNTKDIDSIKVDTIKDPYSYWDKQKDK